MDTEPQQASPIILIEAQPTKVSIPGRESRTVTAQFEVTVSGVSGNETIVGVRDASGRWLKPAYWLKKVAALGLEVDTRTLLTKSAGAHTAKAD